MWVQDIGFLLLQEVTIPEFPAFVGCKAYVNAGANQNGTVAIFRDTMRSEKWTRCPRGGEYEVGLAFYIWLKSTRHLGTQGVGGNSSVTKV